MAISKFKAKCLAVLERVGKTKKPILITRFGKPVAEIVPPRVAPRPEDWIGSLQSRGKIIGDIVSPSAEEQDWEVLKN